MRPNVKGEEEGKVYFRMDDLLTFMCYELDLSLFKISHFFGWEVD